MHVNRPPITARRAGVGTLVLAVTVLLAAGAGASVRFPDSAVDGFTQRYGESALRRLLGWESVMNDFNAASASEKRRAANDFFNQVPWLSDDEHWGLRDYWATPMEMLGTNGGDCEDYSIAKYFTLAELDIPRDQLLITYVRAPRLGQPHMILAWYPTPDAEPLILDNVDGVIRPASERSDLIPVYSFNGDGLWQAVQRGRGKQLGGAGRLLMWRKVLERMDLDPGFVTQGHTRS